MLQLRPRLEVRGGPSPVGEKSVDLALLVERSADDETTSNVEVARERSERARRVQNMNLGGTMHR